MQIQVLLYLQHDLFALVQLLPRAINKFFVIFLSTSKSTFHPEINASQWTGRWLVNDALFWGPPAINKQSAWVRWLFVGLFDFRICCSFGSPESLGQVNLGKKKRSVSYGENRSRVSIVELRKWAKNRRKSKPPGVWVQVSKYTNSTDELSLLYQTSADWWLQIN